MESSTRDVKRVLGTLLPQLPPPAIDFACATYYQLKRPNKAAEDSGSNTFQLRRLDSGNFGEFDLFTPMGKPKSVRRFMDAKLQFEYDATCPEFAEQPEQPRRRAFWSRG